MGNLITVTQAAALAGLARQTILYHRSQGRFPQGLQVGAGPRGILVFDRGEVIAWIQAHQASKNVVQSEAA